MSRLKVLGAVLVVGAGLLGLSAGAWAKPQIGTLTVQGPKTVQVGSSATFRVSVQNRGDEAASGIVVAVVRGGNGSATIARLAPGREKTARVQVRVSGKAGKTVSLRFRARAQGSKAAFSAVAVRLTKPKKRQGTKGGGTILLPAAPQLPSVGSGGR